MASSGNVIVLTPNGRRQNVKVSPNTTILQIIEEVCKKHGFNSEEYDIRHHKQILDINATLRFSGLPNNAQLELCTSTRTRIESEVTIGIHLESGNRLLGTFQPSNTIYEILSKLTPDELEPSKNSVIIYMRQEIYGLEAFKSTDLKSLGLTSGRAILRLIHKSPEELKTQANISAPLPSKPTEEKPYVRKLQRVESPVREPVENISTPSKPEPQVHSTNNKNDNDKSAGKSKNESLKRSIVQKVDIAEVIKSEKKKKAIKKVEPMEVDNQPHGSIEENIEKEFLFLGDRNAMLFSLETAQSVPSEDLPDDFFELTIDDAKKLLRDIKRRRLELESRPLLTSNLRQLEESKKQLRHLNTYTKTIIRVQFPDRTVLQGTFSTVDEIRTVINFVREYLENRDLDFYLYTTPPKQILSEESRLVEIGCVPGALLHFGTISTNDTKTFLRKDLMDKFTTSSTASMAAAKLR
ncbi:tether containing ubx domain for glut4 [Holotrichia oblita]|uniref:Tether containing ubx domain for glut4 n=2 Tax=Holotrichia oblita TaxID=644536 RepID=A0ACB9TWC8_HOLOL|nr:tether containing ubx domain for glut4 [Holotrichia oblita]KAI4471120.1 tether containing ubx domain for glut4 [Holotrichia oblita]